jgi:hypothetical protein
MSSAKAGELVKPSGESREGFFYVWRTHLGSPQGGGSPRPKHRAKTNQGLISAQKGETDMENFMKGRKKGRKKGGRHGKR